MQEIYRPTTPKCPGHLNPLGTGQRCAAEWTTGPRGRYIHDAHTTCVRRDTPVSWTSPCQTFSWTCAWRHSSTPRQQL